MFGLFTGLKKLFKFLLCLVILLHYSSITPKDYLIPTPWLKEVHAPQLIVDLSYAVNIPHVILWNVSNVTKNVYNTVFHEHEQEVNGD